MLISRQLTALSLTLMALASAAQAETGIASRYSGLSHTASGRTASVGDFVAAHKSLPFGSRVRVENLSNGRTVVVTIIDRGPFVRGRIIDVSPAAARSLGFSGLQRVRINSVN